MIVYYVFIGLGCWNGWCGFISICSFGNTAAFISHTIFNIWYKLTCHRTRYFSCYMIFRRNLRKYSSVFISGMSSTSSIKKLVLDPKQRGSNPKSAVSLFVDSLISRYGVGAKYGIYETKNMSFYCVLIMTTFFCYSRVSFWRCDICDHKRNKHESVFLEIFSIFWNQMFVWNITIFQCLLL